MGRVGFEPTKAEPADLQSAPVSHFGICPFWSRLRGSNPGPTVYKTVALPAELRRRVPEPLSGFEPETFSLPWKCSTN